MCVPLAKEKVVGPPSHLTLDRLDTLAGLCCLNMENVLKLHELMVIAQGVNKIILQSLSRHPHFMSSSHVGHFEPGWRQSQQVAKYVSNSLDYPRKWRMNCKIGNGSEGDEWSFLAIRMDPSNRPPSLFRCDGGILDWEYISKDSGVQSNGHCMGCFGIAIGYHPLRIFF